MPLSMRHDPFARGEYERTTHTNTAGRHKCEWCGSKPKRLYQYVWWNDDNNRPRIVKSSVRWYCNFSCFQSYNG